MNLTETKKGTVIEIFVKPNSRKFEILNEYGGLLVCSTEQPLKGKVNKEIIAEFTKLFQRKVEIISGLNSRQKRLLIVDIEKIEVKKIFTK
jgi:uncharacterized protein (TIGR00251 family)